MINKSVIKAASLMLAAVIFLGGCVQSGESGENTSSSSQTAPGVSIDDVSITDNTSLYKDDPYEITSMYLTVRQGNSSDGTNYTWSDVNAHSTYYYDENNIDRYKCEGLLQVGDESGPLPGQLGYTDTTPNSTIQVRGKTTSRAQQKSYQIKLKSGKGAWNDQKTIILNKHIYDRIRFRNKLTYDLMGQFPEIMGARTTFVHLYVKDLTEGSSGEFVDYGLYTQVEQYNKAYLRTHGLDENGQFYKASLFEFFTYSDVIKLSTDPTYDLNAFEDILEIKGSDDHTKLIQMLQDVNNYSLDIEEVFAKHFDEENYFSWLAFQLIIGNTDIVSQNFFLYSPQNGRKWYFISWDNDGAWNSISRIENAAVPGYNYVEGVSNLWGVVLHKRVLSSDVLRQKLIDKIEYYYSQLTREKLEPLFTGYKEIIRRYLFSMPDVNFAHCKEDEFDAVVEQSMGDIEYNYQMILESLERPMPFYCDVPRKVDDKLIFAWENSYDFDDEDITYTIEIATDYNFNNVIFRQSELIMPQSECSMLSDGQYFLRVTATNTSGKTQSLLYQYDDIEGLKHHGVFAFYILGDEITGE